MLLEMLLAIATHFMVEFKGRVSCHDHRDKQMTNFSKALIVNDHSQLIQRIMLCSSVVLLTNDKTFSPSRSLDSCIFVFFKWLI